MASDGNRTIGEYLSEKDAERYFELREMLFEFAKLFGYDEASERAVAILEQARGNVVRSVNEFGESLGHPSILRVHQWGGSECPSPIASNTSAS